MNPYSSGLPAQVALMVIFGGFFTVYGAMGARAHRPRHRRAGRTPVRGHRTRPATRTAGPGTMRARITGPGAPADDTEQSRTDTA